MSIGLLGILVGCHCAAKVTTDHAFLMIGGGSHNSKTPDGADVVTSTIARTTGSIVAELKNVPNQPLVFHQDGTPRTEDDLIGLLLVAVLGDRRCRMVTTTAMVKSAVRAMDCITEFAASEAAENMQSASLLSVADRSEVGRLG